MRARQTGLALAVIASALALVGCGGVTRTIDPVAAAASKTEDAGGAKMSMNVGVTLPSGESLTVNADGVFDRSEGDMTIDLSSVLGVAGLSGAGGSVEMRYLQEDGDPVLYMNVPFLSSRIPGGKPWIRLDLQKAGEGLGIDLGQLMGQANQNPAEVLDMLRASGSVETVGSETLNGEPTTHYKASIDLAKAAGMLGSSAASALVQRLIDEGAPASLPVDVWIGDDGLVRKVTMDESLSSGGRTLGVTTTIELSDYGTPVTVVAPAQADTIDLTALATQAAQHASSAATG